jgi:hypothetical protein
MGIRIRYKADNVSFGALMMSDQTQDLAEQAANFGVLAAKAYAKGVRPPLPAEYVESIKAETGPAVVLGGNPRRTSRIVSSYPWIEFGSGRKRDRPQGGNSPAYRILGRAGARVGDPPRGGGGPT